MPDRAPQRPQAVMRGVLRDASVTVGPHKECHQRVHLVNEFGCRHVLFASQGDDQTFEPSDAVLAVGAEMRVAPRLPLQQREFEARQFECGMGDRGQTRRRNGLLDASSKRQDEPEDRLRRECAAGVVQFLPYGAIAPRNGASGQRSLLSREEGVAGRASVPRQWFQVMHVVSPGGRRPFRHGCQVADASTHPRGVFIIRRSVHGLRRRRSTAAR